MLGSLGLGIYILVSFWLQTLLFYLGMTGCFTKCLAGHLQQKHVNRRVGARAEEHPKENWNHNISIEFATHYNNIMTPSLLLFMMETILIIVTGANKIFIGMNCSVVDRASYKMLIAPSQLFIVWSAMIHWVKLYGILPPRGDYAKWAIFRALHGGIIADSTLSNIICGSSRRNLTRQWTQFPMEAWGGSEYLPPGLWDLLSEKERTRREDMRKLLRENREPGLMESNSRRQENNPENKGLPSKYDYHSSRPAVQKVMAEPQGIALKTAISKFELEALSDDDDD
ncbi:hypothetical protein C8J56DRAFT_254638 [Mycena floridula]|nr:hypothetical protein C8J56DRAFT_254638 [Mycena floridula]